MFEVDLRRYLLYSFLLHIFFVVGIGIQGLFKSTKKTYYSVDFLGGLPGAARIGGGETQKKQESLTTKVINPHEDLLIKSKQKPSKKEKEIISTVPLPPPPPPAKVREGADTISEVPGIDAASGIGIGIGEGGFGGGGGSGGNFPYTWYVQSIRKKLDSNWNVTSGFSHKIIAQVAFTIKRDGSVTNIEIEESSKNELFDKAVVRAVEYSHPFPPLPPAFPESELRVHVRFTLKR